MENIKMKCIYKYEAGKGSIEVPNGWKPLTAQVQRGVMCLWAEVDTANALVNKRVVVCGTGPGNGFHRTAGLTYVGTTQDGDYVWHVYAEE